MALHLILDTTQFFQILFLKLSIIREKFDISSNNPLFDIVAKPYISKVVTNNVSKLDKALSLIADDKGMVDADGLLTDMIDRLIVSKANTINGVTIGEGSVKITIPFMNKTVVFDKDDFNELKTNIENYEKSK